MDDITIKSGHKKGFPWGKLANEESLMWEVIELSFISFYGSTVSVHPESRYIGKGHERLFLIPLISQVSLCRECCVLQIDPHPSFQYIGLSPFPREGIFPLLLR
jgi:hypothetical protein